MPSKAVDHGISDARTFFDESTPADQVAALAPGQLGADESLINALGVTGVAELFGLPTDPVDDVEFIAACQKYNRAFDSELARLIRGGQ